MKLKHFALILSAITFSQATLAAAPLCRSVLRSFTQEQVNAAIEDFTRLTIQSDKAQADGDNSTMTRSLLNSKRLKEKELLENLNISREELRKLVIARNKILQKNSKDESKERAKEVELFRRPEFKLEKRFKTNFEWDQTSTNPAGDLTQLKISSKNSSFIMSLENGTLKDFNIPGKWIASLPDAVFHVDKNSQSGSDQIIMKNINTDSEVEISFSPNANTISSDQQSVVFVNSSKKVPFSYLQVDKNGSVLSKGSLDNIFETKVVYVGAKEWILQIAGRNRYALFNPQTKALNPLNISVGGEIKDLHHGKIAFRGSNGNIDNALYILDMNTNQIISKDLDKFFEIAFSSDNFIWTKKYNFEKSNTLLRSFDINTLNEVIESTITVDGITDFLFFKNSNLLGIFLNDNSFRTKNKFISFNDDLLNPIFDLNKYNWPYFSADGKTLVVSVEVDKKVSIEVWKLK